MNLARLIRSERGVSIIELTFVLPIFLLVLVGLVDIGLTLRNIEALGDIAKDNARYAASKDTLCDSLQAKAQQRTAASLADMGFSNSNWTPEISFVFPGEMPASLNPLDLTLIKVLIKNQRPCTMCLERFLKLSEVRAQAVFALEPRSAGSGNNPRKVKCTAEQIREPL